MMGRQALFAFFTNNGYILELAYSMGLYCHFLERKKHFLFKLIAVLASMLTFSVLWNILKYRTGIGAYALAAHNIVKYLADFGLGYAGILICFHSRPASAIFCMVCAMATQHLSYCFYSCILAVWGLPYASVGAFLIVIFTSVAVSVAIFLIFIRRMKRYPRQYFENHLNILVGALLIAATIVLHFLVEVYVPFDSPPALFISITSYKAICCVFTLMIEHGLFLNNVLSSDKELLERMIHKQEEQYRMSRDSIDMINIKCHDMRHQISHMTAAVDRDAIRELEQIISIYDANLKTGNKILDVLLMEKQLLCEKNNIQFNCIVDGARLSFMSASDIFSLFGNALENAIEASCKIKDEKKRVIALTVRLQLGMIVIHLENNYEGELILADGLPRTTKDDENYHGFGVRSIQMVAEKHKGHVAVLADHGIFNLNITIPMPESHDEP